MTEEIMMVLVCDFTNRGMDLLQCAARFSAALKVAGSLPRCLLIANFPHSRVLLAGNALAKHKLY